MFPSIDLRHTVPRTRMKCEGKQKSSMCFFASDNISGLGVPKLDERGFPRRKTKEDHVVRAMRTST